MSDTAGVSPEDAAAARAAEQARIRKERREAKIKAGGNARLNKITGLGGGLQRGASQGRHAIHAPVASIHRHANVCPSPFVDPVTSQPSTASSTAPTPQPTSAEQQTHADPDEVDISNAEHYYTPQTTNRSAPPNADLNDIQLRQMMLGFDPTASANGANGAPLGANNPFAAMMGLGNSPGQDGPDAEDPMMKMLSQMMSGAGGGAGGAQNPFAAMAGGSPSAAGGAAPAANSPPRADTSAAVWRVLHFFVATGLGLYIALLTQFTGTKVERERGAFADYTGTGTNGSAGGEGGDIGDLRKYFFWVFATAESVLLTSRFFLDKGARGPSGMVATVLGFVPEGKWKSLVVNGLRYSQIFSTVRMDMLVCVFVLGVCSLVRG